MPTTMLSEHFSLAEFTYSQTASREGLDNTPTPEAHEHLQALAAVMEKVRTLCGSNPVTITSGYRSPAVNAATGGSSTSAHMSGLAADFVIYGYGTPYEICLKLQGYLAALTIDQLIWEYGDWVHLAIAPPGTEPKCECLTITMPEQPVALLTSVTIAAPTSRYYSTAPRFSQEAACLGLQPESRPAPGTRHRFNGASCGAQHPSIQAAPYATMPIDAVPACQNLAAAPPRPLRCQPASLTVCTPLWPGPVRGVAVLLITPRPSSYQTSARQQLLVRRIYAGTFRQVPVWELGNSTSWPARSGGRAGDHDYDYQHPARGAYRGRPGEGKAANPAALSCIDTSGHGHFGWTDQLWADGVRWDITGEHFYSERGVVSIRELHLEVGLTDKLALMKKNYGRPVWITEFNYWFADGERPDKDAMGSYLAKTMAEYDGWAQEFQIEAVDIYEMLDQPQIEGREGDFGLYTDNQPNPAGSAVRSYLQAHPSKQYRTLA